MEHLSKDFGRVRALDDVSFEVKDKSRCLLLGANGAGKTTIIKAIMGLLNFEGRILVDGLDAVREGERVRRIIGYVPQAFTLYEHLSVIDEARLVARLKGFLGDSIQSNLELMNLWDLRSRPVGSLSHGMHQRLAIALALLNNPPLLIFDEPLSSIDLKGTLEFQAELQRLADAGKTLLIATHLAGLGELVSQAIILDRGRVVAQGNMENIISKLNPKNKMYIKVPNRDIDHAIETLKMLNFEVVRKGVWIFVAVEPMSKLRAINAIQQKGYQIEDMIVEPTLVESEYLSLVGGSTPE